MNKSRYFYAKIYGAKALITAPESKSGGEKISYDIPTGEVLKGIIDKCTQGGRSKNYRLFLFEER